MTNKLFCFGSPAKCLEYFEEHVETFMPIIKVTSFLDNENLIFTKYSLSGSAYTVLENTNHDTMQLSLVCGFLPEYQYTKRLLLEIGVPDILAEQCVSSKGFELTLSEDMKNIHARFDNLVFFHREPDNCGFQGFMVDAYSKVWIEGRKVFMINPQRNNLNGLFNCLCVMNPYCMHLNLNKNGTLGGGWTIEDTKSNINDSFIFEKVSGAKYLNLTISCELFKVLCFVDRKELPQLVQSIYLFIEKKPIADKDFYKSKKGIYIYEFTSYTSRMLKKS